VNSLPAEVERRRRIVTRAVPLIVVAAIAFAVGASAGAPGSPEKEAAERFATAWARKDFAAMYRELNEASQRAVDVDEFATAYREAAEVATLRGLEVGSAQDAREESGAKVVPVPVVAGTVAFGDVGAELELPYDEGGVDWDASLVFPGLATGEHLENRVDLAPRAAILARDGTALAEGPAGEREHPLGSAAIDVTGEIGEAAEEDLMKLARQGFPAGTPVGVSGLEQLLPDRLPADQPGDPAQDLHVETGRRLRADDEEDEAHRLAVDGVERHGRRRHPGDPVP